MSTLTTAGIFLAACTSFTGRLVQTCRHTGTNTYPLSQWRFGISCSNRCDSCKTAFHFLFHHVASIFPHAEFYTCAKKWWKCGCLVSLHARRKEQPSLLFPSPASLLLFTDEQSSTCIFTLTESQFVAKAGACKTLTACPRLQPMLIAWQHACNNYAACYSLISGLPKGQCIKFCYF